MYITLETLRNKNTLWTIPYKIDCYSSYASTYKPSNILVDNPSDANSRWSTTTNDHRQYIILEYKSSVVSTITFGKFSKIHVCNIKEMKISVSYDKKSWIEVFYGGLKNDTTNETHNLLYIQDELIISRYMKIEPLAAWGMNFNYSIWFIQLKGISNTRFNDIMYERQRTQDIKTVKKILKKYNECILDSESEIERLIKYKDFEKLENYILNLNDDKFDVYVKKSAYYGNWTEIKNNENKDWPCPRGGHQMVCTSKGIYLYGGWDGLEELGDMWHYNGSWKCLYQDLNKRDTYKDDIIEKDVVSDKNMNCSVRLGQSTFEEEINITRQSEVEKEHCGANTITYVEDITTTLQDTPGKRSCHKMCTDGQRLYLSGKYIPTSERTGEISSSDIWVYNGKWVKYNSTGDVASNMYDHYLVYMHNLIYMFGGKTTNFDDSFGGLYKIQIDDKLSSAKWTRLLDSTIQSHDSPVLKGRLGHVLLHINLPEYPNTLAVVGGQRGKEYFKSISLYSLDTNTVYETIPFPIYTDGRVLQRSILYNTDILILFTYGKDKESRLDMSALYSYSLVFRKWTEIELDSAGPMPRTAHQFVLWNNIFYLFGGNVVDTRQSDLWMLELKKRTYKDARRMAFMTVRKHKFFEIYKNDTQEGLKYLRSKVKECVVDRYTKRIFEDTCYEIFKRKRDALEDIEQYINK